MNLLEKDFTVLLRATVGNRTKLLIWFQQIDTVRVDSVVVSAYRENGGDDIQKGGNTLFSQYLRLSGVIINRG